MNPETKVNLVVAAFAIFGCVRFFLLGRSADDPDPDTDRLSRAALLQRSRGVDPVLSIWIAAAPPALAGEDVEAELVLDRTRRIRRTGLTCIIAIGSVFFFSCMVRDLPGSWLSIVAWLVLIAWMFGYLRHVSRTLLLS